MILRSCFNLSEILIRAHARNEEHSGRIDRLGILHRAVGCRREKRREKFLHGIAERGIVPIGIVRSALRKREDGSLSLECGAARAIGKPVRENLIEPFLEKRRNGEPLDGIVEHNDVRFSQKLLLLGNIEAFFASGPGKCMHFDGRKEPHELIKNHTVGESPLEVGVTVDDENIFHRKTTQFLFPPKRIPGGLKCRECLSG